MAGPPWPFLEGSNDQGSSGSIFSGSFLDCFCPDQLCGPDFTGVTPVSGMYGCGSPRRPSQRCWDTVSLCALPTPPLPGLAPCTPLLQWTATSSGSWNRTCLEVLCGSAPGPWCCSPLRLKMEGGHFLSASCYGGKRESEPPPAQPFPLEAGDGRPPPGSLPPPGFMQRDPLWEPALGPQPQPGRRTPQGCP